MLACSEGTGFIVVIFCGQVFYLKKILRKKVEHIEPSKGPYISGRSI